MNRNVIKSLECAPGVLSQPTFVQWSQSLWDGGYSGPTVVHWLHGRPQAILFQAEGVLLKLEIVKPKLRRERKSDIRPAPAPWNRI